MRGTMNRRDIDRLIIAKLEYEEASNRLFYGSTQRLEETSIGVITQTNLKRIAEATGSRRTVGEMDSSGNPTTMEVKYHGCTFYAPVFQWME